MAGVIVILISVLLINTTGINNSFDTLEIFLLFTIIFLSIVAFKIIPNIPLKKNTQIGLIKFYKESITIEDIIGNKIIELKDPFSIKIKLCGYDGQHRLGDIDSLGKGNASIFPDIRPLDGLNNYIQVELNGITQKYEFYIPNKEHIEFFKKMVFKWKTLNDNVQVTSIR